MKAIHIYISALLALVLAGCSSDEAPMTWSDDPNAVIVKATVGGLLTRSNPIADLENDKENSTKETK